MYTMIEQSHIRRYPPCLILIKYGPICQLTLIGFKYGLAYPDFPHLGHSILLLCNVGSVSKSFVSPACSLPRQPCRHGRRMNKPRHRQQIILVYAWSHIFFWLGVYGEVAIPTCVQEDFGVVVGLVLLALHPLWEVPRCRGRGMTNFRV